MTTGTMEGADDGGGHPMRDHSGGPGRARARPRVRRPGPWRTAAVSSCLLLTACASDPAATDTAASAVTPPTASGPPAPQSPVPSDDPAPGSDATPAEVPQVLRFTATTSEGAAFRGASLAGEPVLLWFWAPWCPQCRGQIPDVRDIATTFDGRVQVVGVGSLDDAAAIRGFAAEVPRVTHLVDESGEVWRRFSVLEQSSFVLLDAEGTEVLRSGYGDSVALAQAVERVAGDA